MDVGTSLQKACVSTPLDDAARLVYADWLEEQGDVRGEWIRCEADMAGLAPFEDAYHERKAQREKLRGQIDPGWLAELGYVSHYRPLFTKLPAQRRQRWNLVKEFIETWHYPLLPSHGYHEAELLATQHRLGLLPAALLEWYSLCGKCPDIWTAQDHLHSPRELRMDTEGGLLIFYSENQGCEFWGIRSQDLILEDPPVFELGSGVLASPTLSTFACRVLLYHSVLMENKVFAVDYHFNESKRDELQKLPVCDLPQQYWVTSSLVFYEGNDLLIMTTTNETLYLSARTEEAMNQLSEEFRKSLDILL